MRSPAVTAGGVKWADGYPIAPRRRAWAAIVLYISNAMVMLDMTIANVAVPHIAGNLGASLTQGTWVITSYAVAEAISVPVTGWLISRFGAVRMLLVAMGGFTLFSLLCGLSVTLPMLVVFRVGQGFFGGPILPVAQLVILRIYPAPQLPRAFAYWMLTVMMAPAVGPIIGGAIADQFSWHWIFLINVPVGLLAGLAGYLLLRPAESKRVRLPIDWIGLLLLVVWVGALQLMLDTGREKDWFGDWSIVALAIVAAVGLAVFVIWELTEEHPMVDVRLLRNRTFTMCLVGNAIVYGSYFSGIVIVPQWLQSVMGYSASQAGMITATSALGSLVASQITIRMLLRVDARILVSLGSAWAAFCFALRTTWSTDFDMGSLAMIFCMQGLGVTMMMMAIINMTTSSISLAQAPAGLGISNFGRTMSSAVAAATVISYWTGQQAVSREAMAPAIHPDAIMASLASVGVPQGGQMAYISALVDQQAITVAMLHTTAVTAVAMAITAVGIWAVPYVELSRLKGTQGNVLDH